MKKIVFLIVLSMFVLKQTNGLELNPTINSNELLNYINEKNIKNITEICTLDFCDYIRSNNIERAIEIFKSKYQEFLETKTETDTALQTIIKGFPITRIK